MNLRILFLLLLYYGVLSLVFLLGAGTITGDGINDSINFTGNLTQQGLADSELTEGGLFSSGVSFSRFTLLLGFGIGLPETTPTIMSACFIVWQSIILIFTVGFIISSIWNG